MQLAGISGSLRAQSLNTSLLNACASLLPEDVSFVRLSMNDLPLYQPDLDGKQEAVERFKASLAKADALLIVSPEYNYGIPGPLKNALDWASRPGYNSVFKHLPVGIMGASPGGVGTARMQAHLKQVLLGMVAHVFPYPEVLLNHAHDKFDEAGTLVDAATKDLLTAYLSDFVAWAARIKA